MIPKFVVTTGGERYEKFIQNIKDTQSFEIIEIFNAYTEDIFPKSPFRDHGKMTKGAVGCLLSHMAIWRHISEMTCRFAMIVEDDWVPPKNMNLVEWNMSLENIACKISDDVDYVYLTLPSENMYMDGRESVYMESRKKCDEKFSLYSCLPCFSTGAQLVSPKGARYLLENLGSQIACASDAIILMSSASDAELSYIEKKNPDWHKKINELRKNGRKHLITKAVLRPKMFYKFENKYENKKFWKIAQFGETPILWNDSLTEFD